MGRFGHGRHLDRLAAGAARRCALRHPGPGAVHHGFMDAPTIQPMAACHWPAVRAIYEKGIAGGDATFETAAPTWPAWDGGHLAGHRLVAAWNGRVVGWAALPPSPSAARMPGWPRPACTWPPRRQAAGSAALLERLVAGRRGRRHLDRPGRDLPREHRQPDPAPRCGFRIVGVREWPRQARRPLAGRGPGRAAQPAHRLTAEVGVGLRPTINRPDRRCRSVSRRGCGAGGEGPLGPEEHLVDVAGGADPADPAGVVGQQRAGVAPVGDQPGRHRVRAVVAAALHPGQPRQPG